jgi:hypothetical protein
LRQGWFSGHHCAQNVFAPKRCFILQNAHARYYDVYSISIIC